jgi:DNA-binding NarL/FixJ family response regulator
MTQLMIADDQTMFREGLASLLSAEKDIQIIGQVSNGAELMDALTRSIPDVILLDVSMPVMNGLEAAAIIRERYPEVKIIMVTMHNKTEFINQVLISGAHGYILKNTGIDELREAIQTVCTGQNFYSREVVDTMMSGIAKDHTPKQEVKLSGREKEVLSLIVKEYTSQEIAELLFLSYHTIETHRRNLIQKLNVRNIAGLVKYALEKGFV